MPSVLPIRGNVALLHVLYEIETLKRLKMLPAMSLFPNVLGGVDRHMDGLPVNSKK